MSTAFEAWLEQEPPTKNHKRALVLRDHETQRVLDKRVPHVQEREAKQHGCMSKEAYNFLCLLTDDRRWNALSNMPTRDGLVKQDEQDGGLYGI